MPVPTATREEVTPEHCPYGPRGAALQLLKSRHPECLISGPAGTGKSRACLEKIHLLAEKYSGSRHLILRKTRASITESALVTWEQHVVPAGHPILEGPQRSHRQSYHYPNGSEVVLGGMDRPTRVMSTEYDTCYLQEAIELREDEWEVVTTRLRNGVLPWQQIVADTNPDSPRHWLKRRCDAGKTLLLESRHEDNPAIWDSVRKQYTPAGGVYLARLDALTGPRHARLRHGRWVQAEGIVYEGWDPAVHLIDAFEVPTGWPRWLSIDFGYTNPFCAQWWTMDHDGRLYLYREIYHTGRLVEDHAARIRLLSKDERPPLAVICDHDAEDRATLSRHLGWETTPAHKAKGPGIQAVAARLRPAGDDKPRLHVMRDSLDQRDPSLVEAKKPTCLPEEIDSYCWNTAAGRKKGEEPVDRDNHSLDSLRYLVAYHDIVHGGDQGEPMVLGRMPRR